MKVGDEVEIVPSEELAEMYLMALVNVKGVIKEIVTGSKGNIRGCWVELSVPYLDEQEWYIPKESLNY